MSYLLTIILINHSRSGFNPKLTLLVGTPFCHCWKITTKLKLNKQIPSISYPSIIHPRICYGSSRLHKKLTVLLFPNIYYCALCKVLTMIMLQDISTVLHRGRRNGGEIEVVDLTVEEESRV